MKKYVDNDKLQEFTTKLITKLKTIFSSKSELGDISSLTTTNKTSTVAAINELDSGLDTLDSKIGSLITYRVVTSEAFETATNTSYNKSIAIPTVSGYTPIGVIRIGTNHPMLCAISQYSISGLNVWLAWRQFAGQSDQTWTLTILYVLTSALAN